MFFLFFGGFEFGGRGLPPSTPPKPKLIGSILWTNVWTSTRLLPWPLVTAPIALSYSLRPLCSISPEIALAQPSRRRVIGSCTVQRPVRDRCCTRDRLIVCCRVLGLLRRCLVLCLPWWVCRAVAPLSPRRFFEGCTTDGRRRWSWLGRFLLRLLRLRRDVHILPAGSLMPMFVTGEGFASSLPHDIFISFAGPVFRGRVVGRRCVNARDRQRDRKMTTIRRKQRCRRRRQTQRRRHDDTETATRTRRRRHNDTDTMKQTQTTKTQT